MLNSDLKRYMYKLTALIPLCFQISDNKSVIHCFTKIISSKFIPGDFLINVIFLYDFCYKDIEQKPQILPVHCSWIVKSQVSVQKGGAH